MPAIRVGCRGDGNDGNGGLATAPHAACERSEAKTKRSNDGRYGGTVEWQGTTHRCGGGVPPHVTLGRFVAGKGGSLLPDGGLCDAQLGTPCVYTKEARRHSACYAHKHLRTQLHTQQRTHAGGRRCCRLRRRTAEWTSRGSASRADGDRRGPARRSVPCSQPRRLVRPCGGPCALLRGPTIAAAREPEGPHSQGITPPPQ